MKNSFQIKQQINYLKKYGQFLDDYLEFYQRLLQLQQKKKAKLNREKLSLLSQRTEMDHRLSAGLPLIDLNDVYIDDSFVNSFFRSLLTLFKRYPAQFAADDINRLRRAFLKKEFVGKKLIKNFVANNATYFVELARQINIEPGLLVFMAKTISLPFFDFYRAMFQSQLSQAEFVWFKPLCPLCGNAPAMARLEKEVGQKFLWCSTCNTQWTFTRIQCPFCLNKNQDQLRYFYDEKNKFYRVYVCDNCMRYLKTIDERENNHQADILMTTEDMASHFLDELAAKEGFKNAVWWTEIEKNNV